jgi:hypothetical protein
MIHECGLVSALPRTEVPMRVSQGWWKAGIRFIADGSARIFVIDVSLVNVDSATQLRRRGWAGGVEAALREREAEKRAFRRPGRFVTNEVVTPLLYPSSCRLRGALDPPPGSSSSSSSRWHGRGGWIMDSQPHLHSTWATTYASSYWFMRPSTACTRPQRHWVWEIELGPRGDGGGLLGCGHWGVVVAALGSLS